MPRTQELKHLRSGSAKLTRELIKLHGNPDSVRALYRHGIMTNENTEIQKHLSSNPFITARYGAIHFY